MSVHDWVDQEVVYVCVYVHVNVFQSVDTAGGLYQFGVRIRGLFLDEISNILLWGAVSCTLIIVTYWIISTPG